MLCQCDCRNLPEIAVTAIMQNVSVSFYLVLLPVSMHSPSEVDPLHKMYILLLGLLCLQFLFACTTQNGVIKHQRCGSFTPLERNCRKVNCLPWLQYSIPIVCVVYWGIMLMGTKLKAGSLKAIWIVCCQRQCTQCFPCAVGVLSQWHELSQCRCSLACYLSSPGETDVNNYMLSVSRSQLPL